MVQRLELQSKLEEILGSRNVYFNPPPSNRMNYPAIVYHFVDVETWDANNKRYLYRKYYSITLIHNDPDNEIVDRMIEAGYEMTSSPYVSDGLYHYVFETYI